jgi:hypothetical protein
MTLMTRSSSLERTSHYVRDSASPALIRNKVHARSFSWIGCERYSESRPGTHPFHQN